MRKNESKTARENSNFTGMMVVVMISVLFLVIGGIMIFFPQINLMNFVYVMGGFLLVAGAWEIARYFLREEYRNIANFDFSIGVLLLMGGVVLIVRAEAAAASVYMIFGALVMVLGVTLLQHTFALHALKSMGWIVTLILSASLVLFATAILLDYNGLFSTGLLTYYLLAASGLLGLISLFCVGLRIRHFEHDVMVQKKRDLDDDFFVYNKNVPGLGSKPEEHVIDVADHEKIEARADVPEDETSGEEEIFENEGIVEEEEQEQKPSLKDKLTALRAKKKNQEPDETVFEEE
ncbi:MAG: DUF308 domain-containing protein [Lachnospiraceae bacterium]|nr:DUF308 domain-containing protein [Lachnospiraceae bacterium]